MKRVLLATVVLLGAAWDTPPPPASTATATAQAKGGTATATGGVATALQHQGQHQTATGGNVTINGGAGNVTGDPNSNGSSGWHDPLVASAIAPSFGVAGPCTGTAASVAGQFQVFGLSFGGVNMDKACQSEHLGNVQTVGERIGFEVMCDDSQFRKAALRAHYACSADQTAPPAPAPAPTRPDYCTAGRGWTEAQLRSRYPECRT